MKFDEKFFRMVAFVVVVVGVCGLSWTKQDPTHLIALATYLLRSPLPAGSAE